MKFFRKKKHTDTLQDSQKEKYIIQGENNHLIICDDKGKQKELDLNADVFPGLTISIYGNNNTIKLHTPLSCGGTKIFIGIATLPNNNSFIEIESTPVFSDNTIYISHGSNQTLKIGKNSLIPGCSIALAEKSKVSIGPKCLFAHGVTIRAADGHTLFDAKTGEILNHHIQEVVIGEHCWIGGGVTILKKAAIPPNSVVAERSVVTKIFSEGGIILAGIPAVIKKKGVNWDGRSPTWFKDNNINPKTLLKNDI